MSETIEECRERIREIVAGPGRSSRWIMKHLDYDDMDWCLIYPFAWEQDHYPKYTTTRGGMKNRPVHRMMCEYRNGPPPTPEHHSAHSCNRGTDGCVNPWHVSWKTPTDNQLDRRANGPRSNSKLTVEKVDQIRELQGRARPADLAREFGVSLRNIRLILSGQAWTSEEFRGRRIFTADEVVKIRSLRGKVSASVVADQYKANRSQIDRIMSRASYKWVDESAAPSDPQ